MMGDDMIDREAVRGEAQDLYRSGKFLCSEAIVHVYNKALGNPFPQEVVKLASGFPVGMGDFETGGCTCGALSGGVMVLGMLRGRSNPGDDVPMGALGGAKELHDWFLAEKGSTCCRSLIREFEFGSPDHIDQCVAFTGDVAERLADMLNAEAAH